MKREALTVLLIGGCAVSTIAARADAARAKAPQIVVDSSKSVAEIAGCVALQASDFPGYEIRKSTLPDGVELKLRFRVAGIAATAATIRVQEVGELRRLSGHATGKESGAPRTFLERIRACG
ncbi:hypothetical protein [Sphingomonas sp. ABOLF]|uniref:hypothetical protein n=1 Tax=Sphingomonas sp. ABOLF TaxID=1985879 RepID=UPI0013E0887D|nr:hypothetical protein [Sphingomonas sp. ABOLF]